MMGGREPERTLRLPHLQMRMTLSSQGTHVVMIRSAETYRGTGDSDAEDRGEVPAAASTTGQPGQGEWSGAERTQPRLWEAGKTPSPPPPVCFPPSFTSRKNDTEMQVLRSLGGEGPRANRGGRSLRPLAISLETDWMRPKLGDWRR